MTNVHRQHRLYCAQSGIVVCLALLVGCDDGRPVRVPVSGQVLIDGEPVRGGIIRVVPSGDRPASSNLDEEGRFQLTTFEDGDGCVLGTHRVMVKGVRTEGDQRYWMAPKEYWTPGYKNLTTTIDGATDLLRVDLTWNGEKPFYELDRSRDISESTGEFDRPR